MNHSARELFEICYQYYPKGISDEDPRYKDTEENRRLVATRRREGEPDSTWRRFIRERMIPRLPEMIVQDLSLHLPAGHLDACGSVRVYERNYPKGISDEAPRYEDTEENRRLVAPRRRQGEPDSTWRRFIRERMIPRLTEMIVPNLYLHLPAGPLDACGSVRGSESNPPTGGSSNFLEFHVSFIAPYYLLYAARRDPTTQRLKDHLNLLPSEQPYGSVIVEEIQATYPGYEPLPPEVGSVIVPDIVIHDRHRGEVMLYHALFTDSLLSVPIP